MALSKITIANFRNHAATTLGETAHFNLLVGANGAGKTNLLEAISLLGAGRGLRRAALADLPRKPAAGEPAQPFAIGASLIEQGQVSARIGTYTEAGQPGRRLVRINGAAASANALGEWLALSWLTPAMDGLFTDSAGARRRFIDRMALAIAPDHARRVAQFEAALMGIILDIQCCHAEQLYSMYANNWPLPKAGLTGRFPISCESRGWGTPPPPRLP